jgi:hypothetical protein
MSKKTHDLAVKVREYTDREGNQKAQWQNIGALMDDEKGGMFILLEAWVNLAAFPRREGSSAVLVSCFEPREQDGQQQRTPTPRAGATAPRSQPGIKRTGSAVRNSAADDLDDEIPF